MFLPFWNDKNKREVNLKEKKTREIEERQRKIELEIRHGRMAKREG